VPIWRSRIGLKMRQRARSHSDMGRTRFAIAIRCLLDLFSKLAILEEVLTANDDIATRLSFSDRLMLQ